MTICSVHSDTSSIRRAFLEAFPRTLPILAGFAFAGISYGMYAQVSGFSALYPALMSLFIFGGSLEFVTISMLSVPFAPLTVFLTALMVQSRHFFYGLSLFERYGTAGKFRPYLIYGLCDETFSITCSADVPQDVDRNWFYFFVTVLNHSYWFLSSAAGGLLGRFITCNLEGLDFVMTALFTVIFLDLLMKTKNIPSALLGLICTAACRIIFGAQTFLIPSMILILTGLTVLRRIRK